MNIIGEFPEILFRAFDRRDYAQQFLDGNIRFGAVLGYQEIEDKGRRDKTEGIGHYTTKGVATKIQVCSNVFYALCCHRDLKSALEIGHGKYIVEIENPLQLAKDIAKSLSSTPYKHFPWLEGVNIEYDKGEEKEKPKPPENIKLTYSQKLRSYSPENEFRFVFCCENSIEKNIAVLLKDKIKGNIYKHEQHDNKECM